MLYFLLVPFFFSVFENTPALRCEIRLEPFESKDQDSVEEIAREAAPGIKPGKLAALVRHSGGYPLLIQLMANPAVTTDEIEDPDFESLTRAVGGEKIQKVFQYIEKNLQEPERKALFSLSFTFLPFDRGFIEKFLPSKQVDSLLRRPFFQKETSASLYFIPDIISRYFIEAYRSRYDRKALNKIHQAIADYYRRVFEEGITPKSSLQARQRYLIINGTHLPGRMIKQVIYHYLEAKNYKKARDIIVDYFEHLLETGNALFLEPVLIILKEKKKKPDAAVDFYLARVSEELYKFDQALELYLSLLDRVDSKRDKAAIFQHMGITYHAKQDYETAIKWYQKSVVIKEEIGDKKGLAKSYHQLGMTYDNIEEYEEAIKWYQKSAELKEERGDKKGLTQTYHQMGMAYEHKQEYETALHWYDKSFNLAKETNNFEGMIFALGQKSFMYFKIKNYPDAFINIISAISFAEEYAPHFLPRAQAQLQSFYDQLGEEKSREVLDSL